jgi:hypothetical protein
VWEVGEGYVFEHCVLWWVWVLGIGERSGNAKWINGNDDGAASRSNEPISSVTTPQVDATWNCFRSLPPKSILACGIRQRARSRACTVYSVQAPTRLLLCFCCSFLDCLLFIHFYILHSLLPP